MLIGSDIMGRGSEELGGKLMTAFIQVLHEITPQPDTIIFINSGVKLAVEGSQVIEDLREMEKNGTVILACGTCLGFYELKDKLKVGQISNMYDIATAMFGSGRLIIP
jgi:selenium metabolism protein YedF